jgi:hypothetical protein
MLRSAVCRLPHLTTLVLLSDSLDPQAAQQLPPTLRLLDAMFGEHWHPRDAGATLFDLRHLNAPHTLHWQTWDEGHRLEAVLPPSVTRLMVQGHLQRVSGAMGVRDVFLGPAEEGMCLAYTIDSSMRLLPSLCSADGPCRLVMLCSADSHWHRHDQIRQAAAAIGSASSLTHLRCRGLHFSGSLQPVDCCAELSRLPRLQHLCLDAWHRNPSDMLQWTALTSLSSLSLRNMNAVNNEVFAAVAGSLTGLRQLRLLLRPDAVTSYPQALSAIGTLTNLRGLVAYSPGYSMSDADLMLLSGLTQLIFSHVSAMAESCSAACKQQFLQGMPGLSEEHFGLCWPAKARYAWD